MVPSHLGNRLHGHVRVSDRGPGLNGTCLWLATYAGNVSKDQSDLPALGSWWVAGDSEQSLPGVLSKVDAGYKLVTDGYLQGGFHDREAPEGQFTIHGVSMGSQFTLLDAVPAGGQRGPRRFRVDPPDEYPATAQQHWFAASAYMGGHLTASERIRECRVQNTGSRFLWHSRPLTEAEFKDDGPMEQYLLVDLPEIKVAMCRWPTISVGRLKISAESRLVFVVEAPEGLSPEDLDRKVLYPLNLFVANIEHRATRNFGVLLYRSRWADADLDERCPADILANPGRSYPEVDFAIPLLTADDGDLLARVATEWVLRASDLSTVLAVTAPNSDVNGFLQSEVFQVIGAAEELDRVIHGKDPGSDLVIPLQVFLKERRNELGIDSRRRSRLTNAVRNCERPSLEQRLRRLTGDLGELGVWLLNDQVDAWACVASNVRNEIAHGLHRARWTFDDSELLFGLRASATAITRLRLLLLCGMPLDLLMQRCQQDWYYRSVRRRDSPWRLHAKALR